METIVIQRELVARLQEGCQKALGELYAQYYQRIFQLAMQFLHSPEMAEEIVQDVFVKLWQKRHEIDLERPVEAWLYTVAKNKVINSFKRKAREQAICRTTEAPVEKEIEGMARPDHQLQQEQVATLLSQAIGHLPEKQQEVYKLARLEGYSRNEIAEQMQISALTVKTHMARAMVSVRQFMQQRGVSPTIFILMCATFLKAWY
jgi:RNA polymerase sigma-70 factor (ECF subfamily)